VALALKQSGSCTIELDDWFKLENILATQEREKTDAKQLQILPLCYVEQARTVSKYWLEDMPQQSGMASSLEDILSLRKQKLRQSFRKLEQKLEDIDGLVGGPEHTTERLLTLTYRAFSHYNRRYQILN